MEGSEGSEDRIVESSATEFCLIKIDGGLVEMESTTMLLRLDPIQIQVAWILSLKRTLPQQFSNLFDAPVARGLLVPSSSSLLVTSWDINVPITSSFEINIKANGSLTPSWRNELDLEDFKNEKIWDELVVKSLDAAGASLSGRYVLTNGGTTKSTYLRADQPSIFLAFSTSRFGPAQQDSFVFTTLPDPPPYGQPLLHLATLDSAYRPTHLDATGTFRASISTRWTPVEGIGIVESRKPNLSPIGSSPSFPPSLSTEVVAFPVFRVALKETERSSTSWKHHPLDHAGRDSIKPIRWILPHLPADKIDFEGSIPAISTLPVGLPLQL